MANKKTQHLGELEQDIMQIMWERQRGSVRFVLEILRKKRRIAYTTVMTVMSRLVRKKMLRRTLQADGAYHYEPALSRPEYLQSRSKNIIQSLLHECGNIAVAQFVDVVAQVKTKDAEAWKKMLKRLK